MEEEKCNLCRKKFGLGEGYSLSVGLLNDIEDFGKDKILIATSSIENCICKECFVELKKREKWIDDD